MKKAYFLVIALAVLVGPAKAQEGPPAGALNDAELRSLITGKRLRFHDGSGGSVGSGGVVDYRADGSYTYSWGTSNRRGRWAVEGGRVCYTSDAGGGKRCDWLAKEGVDYFLITSDRRGKSRFTVHNL